MAKLPALIRTAPHIERRIHEALQADRANVDPARAKRLALSQVGKCERDLWGSINGIPEDKEIDSRVLVLFSLGNAVEEHIVQLLNLAGYVGQVRDQSTGEQYRVTMCDGKASGRLDGKIQWGRDKEWILLEIKSANEKKYRELIEVGYKAWNQVYADQLQIYMGLDNLNDSLAIVENKNTSELYSEKIRLDPNRFEFLSAKVERIVNSDTLLPKPPEAKSRYCKHCKWCNRGDWCWSPLAGVEFDE